MASYTIERFHPGLLRGVAQLRRSLFGKTMKTNVAYFNWMYGENPYIDDPPLFVALQEGVPVGMRGTLGSSWNCSRFTTGHTLPCFTDTGITRKHRDRGLYAELTSRALEEFAARGYSHVLNLTPTPDNFVASTLSTGGFRSVGKHDSLALSNQRRGEVLAGRVARRLGIDIHPNPFKRMDGIRKGHPPTGISVTVDCDPRLAVMEELVARLAAAGRIRHVRDSRYFAWRYRNPLAFHRFVYAERGTDLVGYAVLQSPRALLGGADIVDLECVDNEVLNALVNAITRQRFTTLRIWSSTLQPSVVSKLVEHGFAKPPGSVRFADRFILRPLLERTPEERWSIEGVDLRSLENWDLRGGVAITY